MLYGPVNIWIRGWRGEKGFLRNSWLWLIRMLFANYRNAIVMLFERLASVTTLVRPTGDFGQKVVNGVRCSLNEWFWAWLSLA